MLRPVLPSDSPIQTDDRLLMQLADDMRATAADLRDAIADNDTPKAYDMLVELLRTGGEVLHGFAVIDRYAVQKAPPKG